MPKRGGSKGRQTSLVTLSRERLSPDDIHEFNKELVGGNDRACSLIGAAFLDNVLRDLLATYMRDDWEDLVKAIFEDQGAPLADFSSRIKLVD